MYLIVSYTEYLKNFKWDGMKYQTKRSLMDLALGIQKNANQRDDAVRKNMDELNLLKNKISNLSKKDQGNYTVKDYTDEIYN